METTTIISIALTVGGGIVTIFINWLKGAVDELKAQNKEQSAKLTHMEVTLATIVEQLKHKADKA